MKIGCVGLRVPDHVEPGERLRWQIQTVADLGGEITGIMAWDLDAEDRRRLRAFADERSVELESYVTGAFGLAGPERHTARADLLRSLEAARDLGGPVVHCGYGRLEIATSRFNRSITVRAHLEQLIASLREAAKIAEDQGAVLAIENHCDFTGREIAQVILEVGSPALRAAFDTGNSYTVFCDPLDDLEALAPLTVSTHLKDMRIVQFRDEMQLAPGLDRVPFLPIGCALGEGHVDVVATVATLALRSPRGRDLPLIVEMGWMPRPADGDPVKQRVDAYRDSLAYLRAHIPGYLSA
jgi:sugar phosphate isomerase/epimerase